MSQPARATAAAGGDADLASVGRLLADPSRCTILLALTDGRCLPAGMLAAEAGVSASTASSHLSQLVGAGLVDVQRRGRFRYYALAGPRVAQLIETMSALAPVRPVRSLRAGTRAHALRRARTCYDHLAGRLGVEVTAAMRAAGWVDGWDGEWEPTPARAAGAADAVTGQLTTAGRRALVDLGVEVPAPLGVRCCVDWTEQRPHVAGSLGRALLTRLSALDWVRRGPASRALTVTEAGQRGLADYFGVAGPF